MTPESQALFDQFLQGAQGLQGFDPGGYYQRGVNTPQDPGINSGAWNGFLDFLRGQDVIGTSFSDPSQIMGLMAASGLNTGSPWNPQTFASGADWLSQHNNQFSMEGLPDWLVGGLQGMGINSAAEGGTLDPTKPTLVGETGPELLVNGQIIPLEGLQSAQDGGIFEDPLNTQQNAGTFSPVNQPNGGYIQQQLMQNPEVDIFNQAQDQFGGFLQNNPGQGVVDALQPVFNQNLQSSLAALTNMSPSTFNSGIQAQGGDIAQRALNDFNLFAGQALQQGVNQQQQGASVLGQLAGQAGQNPFNRALGAGQLATQRDLGFGQMAQNQQQFLSNYGLQAQNQAFNQQIMPTLQLLMQALGWSTPTGLQTVVGGQ